MLETRFHDRVGLNRYFCDISVHKVTDDIHRETLQQFGKKLDFLEKTPLLPVLTFSSIDAEVCLFFLSSDTTTAHLKCRCQIVVRLWRLVECTKTNAVTINKALEGSH